MLGNVFSPYYARSRAAGPSDPLAFNTMNVAYYGKEGGAWALTEQGPAALRRSTDSLAIGSSRLLLDSDGSLTVLLDEKTAPFGRTLRGRVHIVADAWRHESFALDRAGRHRWSPLALGAAATVDLELPRKRTWTGKAYVDTNFGVEPLERGFSSWDWSRSNGNGSTHVVYDVVRRDGTRGIIRRSFRDDGSSEPLEGVQVARLPRTRWGVQRVVPSDVGSRARVVRSLEDTPFYARTLAETTLGGERHHLVHETVDMDRFESGWVRFLIPFRMRRAA